MRHIATNHHAFEVEENPFWNIFLTDEWEPFTLDIFDRFITKETSVIDVGAWIGPTTLYAVDLAKQVYAIEPDPVAYAALTKNLALNSFSNVKTFQEAIFNHDGILRIGSEALGNSMTRISFKGEKFEIPCRTLESFVTAENIELPLFIKIDAEAAEEFILRDLAFFEKWHPTLYVSQHSSWFENPSRAAADENEVAELYPFRYDNFLNPIGSVTLEHGGFVFSMESVR